MQNKKWVKIVIPVIMIIIIATIWVIQTHSKNDKVGIENISQETINSDLEITSINLDNLKKDRLPIIIDFGSDSCIPCKQMAPVLENINKQMQGKAIIKFVDIWKHQEAANVFPVQVIPTQVFINRDGMPYVPSDEISAKIKFNMYSDKDTGEHVFTVHQGGLTEDEMSTILADMGVE